MHAVHVRAIFEEWRGFGSERMQYLTINGYHVIALFQVFFAFIFLGREPGAQTWPHAVTYPGSSFVLSSVCLIVDHP